MAGAPIAEAARDAGPEPTAARASEQDFAPGGLHTAARTLPPSS